MASWFSGFLKEKIMGDSCGGALTASSPRKSRSVRIQSVENGYTIHPEYGENLIANTLPEALELARKGLE
jgi:hypothetical protein